MSNLLFEVLRQILLNQSILLDSLASDLDLDGHCRRVSTVDLIKKIDDSRGEESAKGSEIDWQKGDIAEVKEGWARAGTRFTVLGPAVFQEQWWVPITDPVEEDPSYYKEASLKKIEGDR